MSEEIYGYRCEIELNGNEFIHKNYVGTERAVPADARLSPESRRLWYEGWNYQDSLMRPAASDAEIKDTASFLKALKQEQALIRLAGHDGKDTASFLKALKQSVKEAGQ